MIFIYYKCSRISSDFKAFHTSTSLSLLFLCCNSYVQQRLTDTVSGLIVPSVLAAAVSTFGFWLAKGQTMYVSVLLSKLSSLI